MREAAARRRATAATRCALHGTCHACDSGAASCLSQLVTPAHATPGLSAAEAYEHDGVLVSMGAEVIGLLVGPIFHACESRTMRDDPPRTARE